MLPTVVYTPQVPPSLPFLSSPHPLLSDTRRECKVEGEVWPCTWPEGIDHGGSTTLAEALQRLHPPQPHPSLTLARTSPAGILVVSHHALELGRQS